MSTNFLKFSSSVVDLFSILYTKWFIILLMFSFSFLFSALLFPIILKLKKHENIFSKVFKDAKMIFWVGGSISFIIYVIVVWGFTKAPIPLVAALRETSIFFSIFIGYFFLKETINLKKIISIALIVIGVIGIKLF